MTEKKKLKFECRECGSNDLGYQKYVRCYTRVVINDQGVIEYKESVYDEDDYICEDNYFICMNCKQPIEHHGYKMETEQDLINYLTIDPKILEEEEKEYERFGETEIYIQEQKKKEQDEYDQMIADASAPDVER